MDREKAHALPLAVLNTTLFCKCMGVGCPNLHYADLSDAQREWLDSPASLHTPPHRPDAVRADPDRPCCHPGEFDAVVAVGRIGEDDPGMPTAFIAEVTVKCRPCGEPFVFDGVPAGMSLSYSAPSTSVDRRELRAPIRPESMPPRHRRGITGPDGFEARLSDG